MRVGEGWRGLARVGEGWRGLARLGKGWQGLARLGKGWQGLARRGKALARLGTALATLGKAWHGLARGWHGLARLGKAWQGLARLGKAWQGLARRWQGLARVGKAWQGLARLGMAWQGLARGGTGWEGVARGGKACFECVRVCLAGGGAFPYDLGTFESHGAFHTPAFLVDRKPLFNLTHALHLLGYPGDSAMDPGARTVHEMSFDVPTPITPSSDFNLSGLCSSDQGCIQLDRGTITMFARIDNIIDCVGATTAHGYSGSHEREPFGLRRKATDDFGSLFKDRQRCLFEVVLALVHEVEIGQVGNLAHLSALQEEAGWEGDAPMDLTGETDAQKARKVAKSLLLYVIWSMELIYLRGAWAGGLRLHRTLEVGGLRVGELRVHTAWR